MRCTRLEAIFCNLPEVATVALSEIEAEPQAGVVAEELNENEAPRRNMRKPRTAGYGWRDCWTIEETAQSIRGHRAEEYNNKHVGFFKLYQYLS